MQRSKIEGAVAYKWDEPADEGWGFKRGDMVLDVRWLTRVRNKVYQYAGAQTILLESVLVTDELIDCKVLETRTSRSKFSQYKLHRLSAMDQTELIRLVSVQKEIYSKKAKKKKRKHGDGE